MAVNIEHRCVYSSTDLAGTCERLDLLVGTTHEPTDNGRCYHVNRITFDSGVDIYVLMDSNCHNDPADLPPCVKREGPWLRIIVKADPRNTRTKCVQAEFVSLSPKRLRFMDNVKKGEYSHFVQEEPIAVAPLYPQGGSSGYNMDHIEVVRTPDTELRRAYVAVTPKVWIVPGGKQYKKEIRISVAVPPDCDGVPGQSTAQDSRKVTNLVDPVISPIVVEALKMLMQDGWKYIKGRLASSGKKTKDVPELEVSQRVLTAAEVCALSIEEIVRTVNEDACREEMLRLQSHLKRSKELLREIIALEQEIGHGATVKDKAAARAEIDRLEEERGQAVWQTYESLQRLFPEQLKLG